jgi:hypothetical protein
MGLRMIVCTCRSCRDRGKMHRRRSTAPSPSNFSPSTAARSCPWTPCRQGGKSDALEKESTLRCCDRYLPTTFQSHDRTNSLGLHSPTALTQRRGNRHENPTAKRNLPFPPHSMAVAMDRKIPILDVPTRQPSHPSPHGSSDDEESTETYKAQCPQAQKPT